MKAMVIGMILAVLVTGGAAMGGAADQVEPATLTYQGTLTDNAGQPVTGAKSMTFSLYDVSSGGTPFWFENFPSVSVKNGQFSVVLGTTKSLTGYFNKFSGLTYIGIAVGSDPEMPQRQKLTSVAYAINSYNGVPLGTVVSWYGDIAKPLPAGWVRCDGSTVTLPDGSSFATPNLSDRFVIGAGQAAPYKQSGGEAKHTIQLAELPNHAHTGITDPVNTDHTHGYGEDSVDIGTTCRPGFAASYWNNNGCDHHNNNYVTRTTGGSSNTHSHSFTTSSMAGGGNAMNLMPPYYALYYIIKVW